MTSSKLMEWAVIIDLGILLLLGIDVFLTYKLLKRMDTE